MVSPTPCLAFPTFSPLLSPFLPSLSPTLGLGNILREGGNRARDEVEQCGGLDLVSLVHDVSGVLKTTRQIEGLQQHADAQVYEKALNIITEFFDGEAEDNAGDEGDGNAQMFAF